MLSLESTSRTRLLAKLARGGSGLLLVALVALVAALAVVPSLAGYDIYVIDGGSMEPSIPRGSLAYDRTVPVEDLRNGDVITYVPPAGSRPVTHRIMAIRSDEQGRPVFRTKGDANERPDARMVTLDRPVQARYSFHIPYLGFVPTALSNPRTRMLLLGLPALFLAFGALRSLWREGGRLQEV
jgi:signal peptidase I